MHRGSLEGAVKSLGQGFEQNSFLRKGKKKKKKMDHKIKVYKKFTQNAW